MKLLIKIYADDLTSASSTIPFTIKDKLPNELTLSDLKAAIQSQISKPHVIKARHQIISLANKNNEVVSTSIYELLLCSNILS